MIDIENMVFTSVYNSIANANINATVTTEYVDIPASFPCVTVMETDNSSYTRSFDDSNAEHHAIVTYEVNVYSNVSKSDAKTLANICDNAMLNLKFTRTMKLQTPNYDRTVYRITMRYIGIVSALQNGIYHMYRE